MAATFGGTGTGDEPIAKVLRRENPARTTSTANTKDRK
jgi:hypothetical protein